MRCCAILTTGIRASQKSPRSVKMESSKIGIEKFNGSDFDFWKMQIEDYLYQKGFHEPLLGGDVGYHDHRAMEAQGSTSLRADPVDAIQKRGVQHHQREDNVRFVEGPVEYVRKTVGYEQGVFDAEIVQSIDV